MEALDEPLGNPWVGVEGILFSHGLNKAMHGEVPCQLPSINYRNEYWFPTLTLSCSLLGAGWDWEELGGVLLGVGWREHCEDTYCKGGCSGEASLKGTF